MNSCKEEKLCAAMLESEYIEVFLGTVSKENLIELYGNRLHITFKPVIDALQLSISQKLPQGFIHRICLAGLIINSDGLQLSTDHSCPSTVALMNHFKKKVNELWTTSSFLI